MRQHEVQGTGDLGGGLRSQSRFSLRPEARRVSPPQQNWSLELTHSSAGCGEGAVLSTCSNWAPNCLQTSKPLGAGGEACLSHLL